MKNHPTPQILTTLQLSQQTQPERLSNYMKPTPTTTTKQQKNCSNGERMMKQNSNTITTKH